MTVGIVSDRFRQSFPPSYSSSSASLTASCLTLYVLPSHTTCLTHTLLASSTQHFPAQPSTFLHDKPLPSHSILKQYPPHSPLRCISFTHSTFLIHILSSFITTFFLLLPPSSLSFFIRYFYVKRKQKEFSKKARMLYLCTSRLPFLYAVISSSTIPDSTSFHSLVTTNFHFSLLLFSISQRSHPISLYSPTYPERRHCQGRLWQCTLAWSLLSWSSTLSWFMMSRVVHPPRVF